MTQIEKRSYGADTLIRCDKEWACVTAQMRVCIIIQSRWSSKLSRSASASGIDSDRYTDKYTSNGNNNNSSTSTTTSIQGRGLRAIEWVTIDRVLDGNVNIFTLLANDTLNFTAIPEQATLHEARCNEVHSKKSNSNSNNNNYGNTAATTTTTSLQNLKATSTSTSTQSSSNAIQAWRFGTTDGRWRDLMRLVEVEDEDRQRGGKNNSPNTSPDIFVPSSTSTSSSTSMKAVHMRQESRRRPLLLYFPHHNKPNVLACHRSYLLAHRWMKRPSKIESLGLCIATMHSSLSVLTQAVVAMEVYRTVLSPVFASLLHVLSNAKQDQYQVVVGGEGGVDMSSINEFVSSSLSKPAVANEIINYWTELLSLTDPLPYHPKYFPNSNSNTTTIANTTITNTSSNIRYNNEKSNITTSTSNATNNSIISNDIGDDFDSIWPSVSDPLFGPLMRAAPLMTTQIDKNEFLYSEESASSIEKIIAFTDMKTIDKEMLLLLRISIQCNKLHHWKEKHKQDEKQTANKTNITTTKDNNNKGHNGCEDEAAAGAVTSLILYGNRQKCLRQYLHELIDSMQCEDADAGDSDSSPLPQSKAAERISLVHIAIHVIYSLAKLWELSLDEVRLWHLEILLENLRSIRQDTEDVFMKIEDTPTAVDTVISSLRIRFGRLFCVLERLPKFGILLVKIDVSTMSWIRSSNTSNNSSVINNNTSNIASNSSNITSITKNMNTSKVLEVEIIGAIFQNIDKYLEKELKKEQLVHIHQLLLRVQGRLLGLLISIEDISQNKTNKLREERYRNSMEHVDILLGLCELLLEHPSNS
eukprot:gene3760-7463_t